MQGIAHIALAALLALAPPLEVVAGSEEIVVIAHAGVPIEALDRVELERLFTASRRNWPDGSRAVVFNLPARHPHRVLFDKAVLGLGPQEVGEFWVDQRVRGGPRPPLQAPSPEIVPRMVATMPGSIGYVPRGLASVGGVKIVARIRAGNVIEPGEG